MTEETFDQTKRKSAKGRIVGLFLAAFAILGLGLWLVRQPIAEAIARGVCAEQGLSCNLSITRLDLGGLTLTGVDARAPGAADAAVTARELAINLAWDGLFSPRPLEVSGDELTLRLDLTGKRSVLGDLEKAVTTFTQPSGQPPGPTPRLQFEKITIIAETVSGPVLATGRITSESSDSFVVDMAAPKASLGLAGGTIDLAGASLHATVAGQNISAALKLDVSRFAAEGASLSDIIVDAKLEQSSGVLKGEGAARLGALTMKNARLASAAATASLESPAIGGEGFNMGAWLASVSRLQLDASTQEGAFAGVAWKKAEVRTAIQPIAQGRSGGGLTITFDDLSTPQAAAGQVEVTGRVEVDAQVLRIVEGRATITEGLFTTQQRTVVADAAAGVLESVLPPFAEALRSAINRAGQSFSVSTPWSARMTRDSFLVSLHSGAMLKSASGLVIDVQSPEQQAAVGTFSYTDATWNGAGVFAMHGGGAPPVTVTVAKSAGGLDNLSMSGTAILAPWKVGNDVISANFAGLDVAIKDVSGAAAGKLSLRVDGGLAGGSWTNASATGEVNAKWDRATFVADAPQGAVIKWDKASYGGAQFGAAALRYAPAGHLAQHKGEDLVGQGRLAAIDVPVTGDGFSARLHLGATDIGWRSEGGFKANFDMEPVAVELDLGERKLPIRIADISGALDLSRGWKVAGGFNGATAVAEESEVKDINGKFDLAGEGKNISGAITGLTLHFHDPLETARYEDANFRGEGHLRNSKVDFTGTFTMAKSGMQIAHVVGRHDLDSGAGGLTFEPTPLIFRPRQFQPNDLSLLLTGPANVTGRVDIGGAATWNADGFKASGVLDLKQLGFVLAAAGVFEGVSGRVEIADLFELKSAPGQRITMDKVTLGLPIEKGTIDFQLIGFDAIRLQNAEWPFGGGFIRVAPMDFRFSSSAENRIVARAVDWDLAKLTEQFKLPDMKLSGVVGGEFPVMFTTGSAVIDNATLVSVKPGVIQYSGSTGDAAAEADANSKMLFDALKDFRYEVLKVGLDGNLTGRMMLTLGILGRNPDVLSGQPFQLNIGIDSALVPLLTSTTQRPDVRTAIEQVKEGRQ
jgi:hypothetical protein